jgi:hypothetical protein
MRAGFALFSAWPTSPKESIIAYTSASEKIRGWRGGVQLRACGGPLGLRFVD